MQELTKAEMVELFGESDSDNEQTSDISRFFVGNISHQDKQKSYTTTHDQSGSPAKKRGRKRKTPDPSNSQSETNEPVLAKPLKVSKKKKIESSAKYPKARRIFNQRNQQIVDMNQKIDKEMNNKQEKINFLDKLKEIIEGSNNEAKTVHKMLRELKKEELPPKIQVFLKGHSVLQKVDENYSKLFKITNNCLKELDQLKKTMETQMIELKKLRDSISEFVDKLLNDYQDMADEAHSLNKSRRPLHPDTPCSQLATNIFRQFKHPMNIRDTEKEKVVDDFD